MEVFKLFFYYLKWKLLHATNGIQLHINNSSLFEK